MLVGKWYNGTILSSLAILPCAYRGCKSINYFLQLKYGCSSSEDHQFVRGIPIYAISQVLEKIISGTPGPFRIINGVRRPIPFIRLLEVELYPTLLSKARSYGLSDSWVQVISRWPCL